MPYKTTNQERESSIMMFEVIDKETGEEEEKALPKVIVSSFSPLRQIKHLLGVLFALVVADGILSNFLITEGLGREWNPFLQTLVGEESFLLIKVAGALLSTLILWDIYKKWPQAAIKSSICIVVLYTGIVYWNILTFLIGQV